MDFIVLRTQDVYPESRVLTFSIPDPDNKKKEEGGNFEISSLTLFGAKNFTKLKFIEHLQKNI
jgi:hypothetical protein